MNETDIRRDQNAAAKQMNTVPIYPKAGDKKAILPTRWSSSETTTTTTKKPFVAKGHDAILKAAQDSRNLIRIVTSGDGATHVGRLVARDKFTITIEVEFDTTVAPFSVRRTFYKHAIEYFEMAFS